MRWKLRAYLDRHGLNRQQLVKVSGLGTRTIYAMAAGETTRLDLHSIEAVIVALRQLTGEQVEIADLLAFEEPGMKSSLPALIWEASRTIVVLEGAGGKPEGSQVRSAEGLADVVMQERDARERGL